MRLVELVCPHCGAHLKVDLSNMQAKCEHCGASLLIDDEVQRVRYENAEEAGYKFEKGRQRAQAEMPNTAGSQYQYIPPKNRHIWLWVLGWICFFPIPLTILILRSNYLQPKAKYTIVASLWIVILLMGLFSKNDDNSLKQDTVTRSSQTEITAESVVESEPVETVAPESVEVESVSIENAETVKTELLLGDTVTLKPAVLPANATNKTVMWMSSDISVVTVTWKGEVTAVGSGEAVVTAISGNGQEASITFFVDASHREMHLRVYSPRQDDVNIGDEWTYVDEVNGLPVVRDYIIAVGDVLNFHSIYTEDDSRPDVGQAWAQHVVTEEDFNNGFEVSMDLWVTENGGKNSGKSAHFVVTYSFSV